MFKKIPFVNRLLKGFVSLTILSYGALYYAFEDLRDDPKGICVAALKISRVSFAGIHMAGIYITHKQQQIQKKHKRASKILKSAFQKNAGLYIKFGQLICSLDVVVPKQYRDQLIDLTYKCPQSKYEDVKMIIQYETGQSMNQIFKQFNQKPIASASMAQVHKATLLNGQKVAVKVQHKGLRQNMKCDVQFLGFIIDIGQKIFPEFRYKWLIEQLRKNLPKQLDFTKQAQNLIKITKILQNQKYVYIPKIFLNPTKRLLVMEYVEGVYIHDIQKINQLGINKKKLAHNLSGILTRMIFKYGFVHGDPHSGNILVRKKNNTKNQGEIILLDHGLYQQLNEHTRIQYSKLWLGILRRDEKMIFDAAKQLGTKNPKLLCSMLTSRKYETLKQKKLEKFIIKKEDINDLQSLAQSQYNNIGKVLNQINRQLLLLFKVNDFSRNIQNNLGGRQASVYLEVAKCCFQNLDVNWFKRIIFFLLFRINIALS